MITKISGSLYSFFEDKLKGASRLAIIGVGSTLRADDGAGVRIIEFLSEAFTQGQYPDLLLCAGETAPENFSGKIRRFSPTRLLALDAADLGLEPGEIAEIPLEDVGGPTFCSHMLPLRVMLNYLAAETGAEVTLIGIQHKSVEFDDEMSREVCASVRAIQDALQQFIQEKLCT